MGFDRLLSSDLHQKIGKNKAFSDKMPVVTNTQVTLECMELMTCYYYHSVSGRHI